MNAVENMSDSPLDLTDSADSQSPRLQDRGARSALPDFEQQWINDYLAGDDSAFISFYHRYRAQVYRYLLAHMSLEAANRLFVQTWLDFIRNARHIPTDISPGAAVFAEAHRLVLEAYRSLDKSLLLSFADGVVETAGEVPPSGFTDHEELQKTRLATVPPAWREALQLYLETGFDGDSLAYALHVSRDTARSRLKRAFSMWRKLWPDGDTGVEDTLLRSTQHWIFRYRSLVGTEPPDYLDARILRQADWQTHWLPRMVERIDRYWHIGLTAILTGLGVFGYLWTMTASPDFTLEISQPAASVPVIASPVMAPVVTAAPAPAASAVAASAVGVASAPVASSVVAAPAASAATAKPAPATPPVAATATPHAAPAPVAAEANSPAPVVPKARPVASAAAATPAHHTASPAAADSTISKPAAPATDATASPASATPARSAEPTPPADSTSR